MFWRLKPRLDKTIPDTITRHELIRIYKLMDKTLIILDCIGTNSIKHKLTG